MTCRAQARNPHPAPFQVIKGGVEIHNEELLRSQQVALQKIKDLPADERAALTDPDHPLRAVAFEKVFGKPIPAADSSGQARRHARLLNGNYLGAARDPSLSRRIRWAHAQEKPSVTKGKFVSFSDILAVFLAVALIGLIVAKYGFGVDTNIWNYIPN